MTFFFVRLGDPGRERPFVVVDGIASAIDELTADIDATTYSAGTAGTATTW